MALNSIHIHMTFNFTSPVLAFSPRTPISYTQLPIQHLLSMPCKYPKFNMTRRIVDFHPCPNLRLLNHNKGQYPLAFALTEILGVSQHSSLFLRVYTQSMSQHWLFYLQSQSIPQPLLTISTATCLAMLPFVL